MSEIYKDIAKRCGGNIYVGVVGPVRTGKSTFIKRFMESLVLPNIEDENAKRRALDEMPQSAAGRTVMTTEPKFVPDEPVRITIDNGVQMNLRMVDCVGYIVDGAWGLEEDGAERMVNTPWSEEPMSFCKAAELGTSKVIREHSSICMLVTTDGSITELEREGYTEPEKRIVSELRATGIPFVIVLNSAHPESEDSVALAAELEKTYLAPVALVNCTELDAEDIRAILSLTLSQFPIKEIHVKLPAWANALDSEHDIRRTVREYVYSRAKDLCKISELADAFDDGSDCKYVSKTDITGVDLGSGIATLEVALEDGLYYQTVSELTGLEINNEQELIRTLARLALIKKKYDRISDALDMVEEKGYGIVMPDVCDLKLEEPEIVKQAGGYGVKLRASAPSIHMIKAGIETEISPVVGTEQQSEDLVKYLLERVKEDPGSIWESNMFGRTLYELVNDGLNAKLENMPDDAREKLCETLGRIVNEGSGGLICIIL